MKSILINTTKMTFLKATKDSGKIKNKDTGEDGAVRRLEYWADILAKHNDFIIVGEENKWYSCFNDDELRRLYVNTQGAAAPSSMSYSELLKTVAKLGCELPVDNTPVTKLREQLGYDPTVEIPKAEPIIYAEKKEKTTASKVSGGRPKAGTTTGQVWDMGDELKVKLGRIPTRKEIIEALPEINPATVSTQFAKWKKSVDN